MLNILYGGTKEEMERLLVDADKLSDSFNLQVDASGKLVYSYADVVDAIHIVQTKMGITGTTAKEAGTTIQGSVDSMKAAWTNLVTGLGDENANIEQLFDDLVVTITGDGTETNLGVMGTVIPRVKVIFENFTNAIKTKLSEVDWKAEGEKLINLIAEGIDSAVDLSVKIQGKIDKTDWESVGKAIGDGIAKGIDLAEAIGEAIKNTDWEQLGKDMAQYLINSFQKNVRANIQVWGGITGTDTTAAEKKLTQGVAKFSNLIGFDETLLTTDEGTLFVPNDIIFPTTTVGTGGIEQSGGGRGGSRTINYTNINYVQGNFDDAAQQKNDMVNLNNLAALG